MRLGGVGHGLAIHEPVTRDLGPWTSQIRFLWGVAPPSQIALDNFPIKGVQSFYERADRSVRGEARWIIVG